MSMLRTFFFKDKRIWQEGAKYRDERGKHQVIFLTFKDAKEEKDLSEIMNDIASLVSDEYNRHSELFHSPRCSKIDLKEFALV